MSPFSWIFVAITAAATITNGYAAATGKAILGRQAQSIQPRMRAALGVVAVAMAAMSIGTAAVLLSA